MTDKLFDDPEIVEMIKKYALTIKILEELKILKMDGVIDTVEKNRAMLHAQILNELGAERSGNVDIALQLVARKVLDNLYKKDEKDA